MKRSSAVIARPMSCSLANSAGLWLMPPLQRTNNIAIGQSFLAANQPAMARAVFEATEKEVAEHGLETWEPALASASAEGLVQSLRALAKGGKPLPPEAALLYDRVCRLDPTTALKLGA